MKKTRKLLLCFITALFILNIHPPVHADLVWCDTCKDDTEWVYLNKIEGVYTGDLICTGCNEVKQPGKYIIPPEDPEGKPNIPSEENDQNQQEQQNPQQPAQPETPAAPPADPPADPVPDTNPEQPVTNPNPLSAPEVPPEQPASPPAETLPEKITPEEPQTLPAEIPAEQPAQPAPAELPAPIPESNPEPVSPAAPADSNPSAPAAEPSAPSKNNAGNNPEPAPVSQYHPVPKPPRVIVCHSKDEIRNYKLFPIFNESFPERRLNRKADPGIRAPAAGTLIEKFY